MKRSLFLKQNLPLSSVPVCAWLEDDKICVDDLQLPKHIDPNHQYNPHNYRMFVIGHEHGAICAVFAAHEQEAFDKACDKGFLECIQVEEDPTWDPEGEEGIARFGNASEPHDLTHAWIGEVSWEVNRDFVLILDMMRAYAGGEDL